MSTWTEIDRVIKGFYCTYLVEHVIWVVAMVYQETDRDIEAEHHQARHKWNLIKNIVCFITKSFLTYSFFPPTPALSTISRPLSSSMCSITPETANVCSSLQYIVFQHDNVGTIWEKEDIAISNFCRGFFSDDESHLTHTVDILRSPGSESHRKYVKSTRSFIQARKKYGSSGGSNARPYGSYQSIHFVSMV